VHTAAVPFTNHCNVRSYVEPKTIFLSQTFFLSQIGFSSSNFIVQDHIPSIIGEALRASPPTVCHSGKLNV
jgi:hypothetical protein